MKKRYDFHTHCLESTGDPEPKKSTIKKIITQAKSKGLDGLAVTDHDNKDYGFRVKKAMDQLFPHLLDIIPGREIHVDRHHVVELFLSNHRVFRFVAHPFFGSSFYDFMDRKKDHIHGIEIKNAAWQLQEDKIKETAKTYDLILLKNSDAHSLNEIGLHSTVIDLQELYDRCNGKP